MKRLLIGLFCVFNFWAAQDNFIDVVIPCHSKDSFLLDRVIAGIRKNVVGARRIIIVSDEKFTDKAEWFDDRQYPFSKNDVLRALFDFNDAKLRQNNKRLNAGWFFQQLLKLYAPFVIPRLSDNFLVVDADTIFIRPVRFFDHDGYALYAYKIPRNKGFLQFRKRLIPLLSDRYPHLSGVVHHMLFQRGVLFDLFRAVEKKFKKKFWHAFCSLRKGISEFDAYFGFIFANPEKYRVKLRLLFAANVGSLDNIDWYMEHGFTFVSYHHYLRQDPTREIDIP